MALVYLRHPLHGEKAETNDMISAMDKANGWVEFDPTPAASASETDPVVDSEAEDEDESEPEVHAPIPSFLMDPPPAVKPKKKH